MRTKLFLFAVAQLGMIAKRSAETAEMAVRNFKTGLRQELSAIGFKAMLGLALVGLIIIALAQLAAAVQEILQSSPNGDVLDFVIFGGILVVGLLLLYLLFKGTIRHVLSPPLRPEKARDISLATVVFEFVQGFRDGLDKARLPPRPGQQLEHHR